MTQRVVWAIEPDKALFAMVVRVLKEHHDLGRKWPLSYTLPNGRSVEAVSDRVAHLDGEIPSHLLRVLHNLAVALSVAEPERKLYGYYAPVLREIAARLALPFDQRRPRGSGCGKTRIAVAKIISTKA
jgi:hypothetical protein